MKDGHLLSAAQWTACPLPQAGGGVQHVSGSCWFSWTAWHTWNLPAMRRSPGPSCSSVIVMLVILEHVVH